MPTANPAVRAFRPTLALCLALIGAAAMIYYHEALFMPQVLAVQEARGLGNGYSFGRDFYQIWLSARQWFRHGIDPYGPEMTREIQIGLYGRPLDPMRATDPIDARRFPYPLFTDLIFWPATTFSFPAVRIAVVCGLILLTLASVPLWLRALGLQIDATWLALIALLTISSYPVLEGLYAAQIGLAVAFLLPLSLVMLKRGRYWMAGLLLALTTMKPQVTALPILFLLIWSVHEWRRRGRFLIGFFLTLSLLVGSATIAQPHWISSWMGNVFAYHHYTAAPLVTQVLTEPLGQKFSSPATVVLSAASFILAGIIIWRNRAAELSCAAFNMSLAILLALTTITLLPGQAIYDHAILLPAILLLARQRHKFQNAGPAGQILFGIGALILFWPWCVAVALIVLRPFVSGNVFNSAGVMPLPIRTAASLPFALFALLLWNGRFAKRNSAAA